MIAGQKKNSKAYILLIKLFFVEEGRDPLVTLKVYFQKLLLVAKRRCKSRDVDIFFLSYVCSELTEVNATRTTLCLRWDYQRCPGFKAAMASSKYIY